MRITLQLLTSLSVSLALLSYAQEGVAETKMRGPTENHDKSFGTLDEYLAFLQQRGAMDMPYYQLQPDGRYLLVRGRGTMNDPRFFTRQQLLEKFGFSE